MKKIKVIAKSKTTRDFKTFDFDCWKDFLDFYNLYKYSYYLKICLFTYEYKLVNNEWKKVVKEIFTIFNCGILSRSDYSWKEVLELHVNPESDREILRVYRHIRLDYKPTDIFNNYLQKKFI